MGWPELSQLGSLLVLTVHRAGASWDPAAWRAAAARVALHCVSEQGFEG